MPVTCCMLQRFGSGPGQNGSTLKAGAPFSPLRVSCPSARTPKLKAKASVAQTPRLTTDRAIRVFVVITGVSSAALLLDGRPIQVVARTGDFSQLPLRPQLVIEGRRPRLGQCDRILHREVDGQMI